MDRLRVVFAGTPDFAAESLKVLLEYQEDLNIKIVAVYTQPDRKAGRGQKLSESPVKKLAIEFQVPVEQPESFSLKHEKGLVSRETLESYHPDLMIVAAYGLILPLGVLNIPKMGCLNIHASLLPRWRGAAPIQRAILQGDKISGITIMKMNQGLDTGDILYTKECDITENETDKSLHDKLATLGAVAIKNVLSDLEYFQNNAKVQDDSLANYAKKILNTEGLIDWTDDAFNIYRKIRALNAYTYYQNQRIKILSAKPIRKNQITNRAAGQIVGVGKNAILVACGKDDKGIQHLINLDLLQWPGGKPLNPEQIANGDKLNEGQNFEMI